MIEMKLIYIFKCWDSYFNPNIKCSEGIIMKSVLNYMTVSNVLDLQEIGCLNADDYYYYVEGGVIKYEERERFMERTV